MKLEKLVKNDICWCKNFTKILLRSTIKQQWYSGWILQISWRSISKTLNTMGYTTFVYLLYPLEIPDKSKLHPWTLWKPALHPLEIPRPKTKTPGDSTYFFLGHPWKLHMLLLWYPREFHILNTPSPPVCFFSKIIQCKEGEEGVFFFHFILVGISSILILSIKNTRRWVRRFA